MTPALQNMLNLREVDFLVVDDSQDAANALSEMLQLLGRTTHVTYSAHDALATADVLKPLCVMLDIGMPNMDGLELAREFRRRFGDDVVLVAVTGHSSDDPRVAETFAIVDHYFRKPLSVDVLKRILP